MYWSIPSGLQGLVIPDGDIAEYWGPFDVL